MKLKQEGLTGSLLDMKAVSSQVICLINTLQFLPLNG